MMPLAGIVSARYDWVGGDSRRTPDITPAGNWYTTASTLVLLVHGYNVTQGEALDEAYGKFLKILPERMNAKFVGILWPGDEKYFSTLRFPWTIGKAEPSAECIAKFVAEIASGSSAKRIIIVAHSLGCRVMLEMFNKLQEADLGPAVIEQFYAMAAAVPVNHLEENGRYREAEDFIEQKYACFSSSDMVLQLAFRLGNPVAALFGEETGLHFEATGVEGEPRDYWTDSFNFNPNGHSSYWKDFRIASRITRILGGAPDGRIAENTTAIHNTVSRQDTPFRDTEVRKTPDSRFGSRLT